MQGRWKFEILIAAVDLKNASVMLLLCPTVIPSWSPLKYAFRGNVRCIGITALPEVTVELYKRY